MFNRAELKENAKKMLTKNYWWIVLVTLILGLVSNSGSGININLQNTTKLTGGASGITSGVIDEFGNIVENTPSAEGFDEGMNYITSFFDTIHQYTGLRFDHVMNTYLVILMFFASAMVVVCIFALNPLQVGCRKWFINNKKGKAELSDIIYCFTHNYLNVVKIMFFKLLKTFLWSLLFIIPGIIKAYEYRMIPYLLAENPNMSMEEAFARSKKMMDGNKMATFVLELSFIGWMLVACCGCGILNLFFVNPYRELTNTELYVCLCQGQSIYSADNNNDNGNSYNNHHNGEYNNQYNSSDSNNNQYNSSDSNNNQYNGSYNNDNNQYNSSYNTSDYNQHNNYGEGIYSSGESNNNDSSVE